MQQKLTLNWTRETPVSTLPFFLNMTEGEKFANLVIES